MKILILYSIFLSIFLNSCAKKSHHLVDIKDLRKHQDSIDPTMFNPPGTIQINDILIL